MHFFLLRHTHKKIRFCRVQIILLIFHKISQILARTYGWLTLGKFTKRDVLHSYRKKVQTNINLQPTLQLDYIKVTVAVNFLPLQSKI